MINETNIRNLSTDELKEIANEAAIASNKAYKAKDFEAAEYFNSLMHIAILEYQAR